MDADPWIWRNHRYRRTRETGGWLDMQIFHWAEGRCPRPQVVQGSTVFPKICLVHGNSLRNDMRLWALGICETEWLTYLLHYICTVPPFINYGCSLNFRIFTLSLCDVINVYGFSYSLHGMILAFYIPNTSFLGPFILCPAGSWNLTPVN